MRVVRYKLYPLDPRFVPDPQAAEYGEQWLRARYPECGVQAHRYEHPYFLHCGEGLDHIVCPACGEELDMRDWQDIMDYVYGSTRFQALDITTPCCESPVGLNRLIYDKHCDFASFCYAIEHDGAGVPEPDEESLAELAALLGCLDGCGLVVEIA